MTLAAVAERVGYGGPFALSSAFKRVRGVSPRQYRASVAADGPAGDPETAPPRRAGAGSAGSGG